MKLEVTTFQNEPMAQPLVAMFDEMGGTIGRADGSTLVLHDAKRYISRSQASISFRGGTFLLRDGGSATPTYVNQTPVGNGNEVTLKQGDELRIGEYTLSVSINAVKGVSAHAQISAADPFSDLHAEPPRRPAPPPISTSPVTPNFDDPFARPAAGAASDQQSGQQHVIPQDYDPFADLSPVSSSDQGSPGVAGLGASAGAGVDDLFRLKQPSSWTRWSPTIRWPARHMGFGHSQRRPAASAERGIPGCAAPAGAVPARRRFTALRGFPATECNTRTVSQRSCHSCRRRASGAANGSRRKRDGFFMGSVGLYRYAGRYQERGRSLSQGGGEPRQ
jgi:predicted component of type VI protein secretion system